MSCASWSSARPTRRTPSRRSGPRRPPGRPTSSRPAAARNGPPCGPRPTWTRRSAPWRGCACRRSPTGTWPTWPCSWWSAKRDRPGGARRRLGAVARGGRPGPKGGGRPPAGAAVRRGLVERRAGNERDDGCRGSAAQAFPRHPRRGGGATHGEVDPFQPARGRHVGDLLRGAAGPLGDGGGVRRPPPRRGGPRRALYAQSGGVVPLPGGYRREPCFHPYLAGSGRPLVVGGPARRPPRDHVPAAQRASQHLRLRLLGAPDDRAAHRLDGAAARQGAALRPVRAGGGSGPLRGRPDLRTTGGRFEALDRLLHHYGRLPGGFLPRRLLRDAALRRAEEWIVRRQEADGLWGGIQPPVVYSVMALHALGYPVDHPVVRSALDGIESFTIDDAKGRRLEACQSPVWDTALAVVALCDAGVDPAEPPVSRAVRWLLGEEVAVAGDWAVRRPGLAPGGWAFEFHNDNYPDIDDTAEVVLALRAAAPGDPAVEAACRRAVAWVEGMQSRSGGWGAFDADNTSRLAASLPFCDFGEVTDPPSADVTAHVIEMLAGEPGADPAVLERGLRWLSGEQEADGSWFGRWGVNHVYGTGAAVPALVAAGVPTSDPRIRRAVSWLESCQNDDGGWGEDLRSYVDPAWRGRGASTPSQTAWALLALLAAGAHASGAVERGIQWLAANQLPDGGWDEPWFTGTGFPWDFTINYHLYRLVWPLMALGRYVNAGGRRPPE